MREIQTTLLPFQLDRKTINVDEGKTIKEMVELVFPRKIYGVRINVTVNDMVLEEDLWDKTIPPVNSFVCLNAVPAGGKGKNPFLSVLMIVTALSAAFLAPELAALAGFGAGMAGAATVTAAFQVGIGAIGMLATSMLASAFQQKSKGSSGDLAESSTQFISGASNTINRYGVIPINLGTNRMFPPQAALPYTETVGNLQYVRQLFTYGYGKHVLTDRKLGDTSISEFNGVEIEDRLNGDLKDGTSLYSKDVYQTDYNVAITHDEGFVTRTTQQNSNEAEYDLTFQSGLAEYNDQGNKITRTVQFIAQYALTGTENWSTGAEVKHCNAKTLTIPRRVEHSKYRKTVNYRSNRHLVLLNYTNGNIILSTYSDGSSPDPIPEHHIRIASLYVTDTISVTDERSSYIPERILNSSSFIPSVDGTTLTISEGYLSGFGFSIRGATAEPLRVTNRFIFPTAGQYDLRVRRTTSDSTSDRIIDTFKLTAIRSIKNYAPVNQEDVSGSAIRILGTDQLNGSVENYNVILSTLIPCYNVDTNVWSEGISSDPASLYRYVLQCNAFLVSKRLPNSRINISKLEEWSEYCQSRGLTYNRVIDYDANIDEVLDDICAAGMATKHKIDGVYSVIIDNERDVIKGLVTPRNSWGYKGSITYPELPHALRVQFRNPDVGYEVDEIIVYQDGYNESNATDIERLEINSCTNASLAYYYGRRYLASLKLQPEVHTWNMDFENLAFNRGQRIQLINDVILVGVGQGRVLELVYDDEENPSYITGFIIDEDVTIPNANVFGARIRHADASSYSWYELSTVVGTTREFDLKDRIAVSSGDEDKWISSLCAFTEFGKELDLIVTSVTLNKNHDAVITAINYAPERFNADIEVIPPFNSNITLSIGNLRPLQPILNGEIVSNESVMSLNSDGSYTSRMVINLTNLNEPSVQPFIRYQRVGETQWYTPDILTKSSDKVVINGLQDGSTYNFEIRYQRQTGQMLISAPLTINNVKFIGAGSIPSNVLLFKLSISGSIGIFEWSDASDIDVIGYKIKHSRLTTGATWASSQVVKELIVGNSLSIPIQSGTYLIKAIDILGNESEIATTIINFNDGILKNVVENLVQQTSWNGVKVNCNVYNDELYLTDPTSVGYYYFDPSVIDFSEIYECQLSSSLRAFGSFYQRVRNTSWTIRELTSLRCVIGSSFRSVTSVRGTSSVRGLDENSWGVSLQLNTSLDNVTWSGWEDLKTSSYVFRYVKLRLVLRSTSDSVSPRVTVCEVKIDMPDRVEYGENITCPSTGVVITYAVPFKNNPSVTPVLQDGAVDDKIEYVYKTPEGFSFKVYNGSSSSYVTRSFDYTSNGYGRVV